MPPDTEDSSVGRSNESYKPRDISISRQNSDRALPDAPISLQEYPSVGSDDPHPIDPDGYSDFSSMGYV
jgi:hypothetical protein